jgi:hypothetical protein
LPIKIIPIIEEKKMQINSFSPTQGNPGSIVTIDVAGFGAPTDMSADNTVVMISGDPQISVTSITHSDTIGDPFIITASIDNNAQSGEFTVIVQSAIGTVVAQSSEIFTVIKPDAEPVINNMTPRQATAGQTQITLTGMNLNEIEFIRVGNTAITSIIHPSNSTIRFTVPSSVSTGNQRVSGRSEQYGRINVPYMLTVQE